MTTIVAGVVECAAAAGNATRTAVSRARTMTIEAGADRAAAVDNATTMADSRARTTTTVANVAAHAVARIIVAGSAIPEDMRKPHGSAGDIAIADRRHQVAGWRGAPPGTRMEL
jgi:hypothetical protein